MPQSPEEQPSAPNTPAALAMHLAYIQCTTEEIAAEIADTTRLTHDKARTLIYKLGPKLARMRLRGKVELRRRAWELASETSKEGTRMLYSLSYQFAGWRHEGFDEAVRKAAERVETGQFKTEPLRAVR